MRKLKKGRKTTHLAEYAEMQLESDDEEEFNMPQQNDMKEESKWPDR